MKAVVFNNQCEAIATLGNLPNKLHQAAEDFECALQEAVLDARGFDAVENGRQLEPMPCELHRVVFDGRYAINVDHVELLTRYSPEWCLAGGYMFDSKRARS